jgi:hypothetical protein
MTGQMTVGLDLAVTGTLWGDFPRTYSQAGPISAAMRLSRSGKEGTWHAS